MNDALVKTTKKMSLQACDSLTRMAPQPRKDIELAGITAWQYFYLGAYGTKGISDSEICPCALMDLHVIDNDLDLQFDIVVAEGAVSTTARTYAVDWKRDSYARLVGRVAYKNTTPGSIGKLRFTAEYNADHLAGITP